MPENEARTEKRWDIGKRVLTFETRPLVMGILNVTPDSFSDGGRHNDPSAAIELALAMQSDGADIIDIGGESTRPYSDPVAVGEEIDRVLPVIQGLAGRLSIPISIDTSKATVAKAAIDAGAEIINDVTGLEGDPAMPQLAVDAQVGVCVMHMRGTPQTMQDDPTYDDVVEEIYDYLQQRLAFCLDAGLAKERVCLDPGIGFGKTHEHNLRLLRHTARFCDLDAPILIGHSRKGFIGKLLGDKTADRTAATLGVSLAVAAAGAHVIRVHDVRPTVDALKLFRACGGIR
ncbi:dihydropteroate synthase [Stieleria mannarensis]|uniref:dihydropteroate synthase n=1 Tax=Stieleria mannarensis TaxID=2755585 RepID=UPI003F513DBB